MKDPFTGGHLPESALRELNAVRLGISEADGKPWVMIALRLDGKTIATAIQAEHAVVLASSLLSMYEKTRPVRHGGLTIIGDDD